MLQKPQEHHQTVISTNPRYGYLTINCTKPDLLKLLIEEAKAYGHVSNLLDPREKYVAILPNFDVEEVAQYIRDFAELHKDDIFELPLPPVEEKKVGVMEWIKRLLN